MDFANGFNEMFHGMFGMIQRGQCRLAMNGRIAIKTSSGYKTYDLKKNRLTNCSNFVLNGMDEFFFVVPTSKVRCGDIILKNGHPRCVIKVENNQITAVNYEDSTVEVILPERHVFSGNTYFYGKIISMFGGTNFKGKNGFANMLKYMIISELLKSANTNTNNNSNNNSNILTMFGSMAPFFMLGNTNMNMMFDGLFDFDDSDMTFPIMGIDTEDDTDDTDDADDTEDVNDTEDNE